MQPSNNDIQKFSSSVNTRVTCALTGEGVAKNTDGGCITVAKSITSLCFTTTKRIYRIKTRLPENIYISVLQCKANWYFAFIYKWLR